MRKCVLLLFNSSVYAAEPWLHAGIPVVSVDYHDTDHSLAEARKEQASHPLLHRLNVDLSPSWSAQIVEGQCRDLGLRVALVISFAPCTDLAVSGARHFAAKRAKDPQFQVKAASMARRALWWDCPYVVENPVSVLSTLWRKPDLVCHPSDFGGYLPEDDVHPEAPDLYPPRDAYRKKTCLWAGFGFELPSPRPVPVATGNNPGWAKLGGRSARTKHLRSLTPRGLMKALFHANLHLFCVTADTLRDKLKTEETT